MKTKLKLLLIPFLVLALTACGKTPEERFNDALAKTDQLDSAHMDCKLNLAIKTQGVQVELPITIASDIDNKSSLSYMKLSMSLLGMDISVEEYVDSKNLITYSKTDDVWIKEKLEDKEFDLLKEFDIYSYTKLEEIKDKTQNDEYFYQVTYSKDMLMDLIKKLFEEQSEDSEDMFNLDNFKLNSDVVFDFYVDKKTGYLTKVKSDLKELVSVSTEEDAEVEITTFDIECNYSNFNKTNVTEIPKEVIDGALDSEVAELKTYAEEYIFAVEDYAWSNGLVDRFTSTNLEYSGPKPDAVDLKLVDGSVISGTIKINGYTMNVADGEVSYPTK